MFYKKEEIVHVLLRKFYFIFKPQMVIINRIQLIFKYLIYKDLKYGIEQFLKLLRKDLFKFEGKPRGQITSFEWNKQH